MSHPVSIPNPQPQPNQLSYPVDLLSLFQNYTRDSYFATFGVQAPAWDPTRVRKAWFDSSFFDANGNLANPTAMVFYQYLSQDTSAGTWSVQPLQISAAQAATVNLPGAMIYPPYAVAPTGAMRSGTPVSPVYLSLQSDANALLEELKGTSLFDQGEQGAFPVLYPSTEPRRMWVMNYGNGQQLNVGLLLSAKNANGMGAPGHWDASSGTPIWVADPPAPTGLDDTRPACPLPVRALLPNEALRPAMTGIGPVGVQVVRTDLELQAAQQSGAFLPGDRAMLQQILSLVTPPAKIV